MRVIVGEDGLARCGWVGTDSEYIRYHDEEWGVPLHGDRALFEKLILEGFQAGLSWITILRRRESFREAFHGFDLESVAAFTPRDVDLLMENEGIIRNRQKIEATIGNARITRELTSSHPGAFDELIWSFAPAGRAARSSEVRASSEESVALSTHLKGLGYRFVGPTTAYALMQSAGLVDDHAEGCWRATS